MPEEGLVDPQADLIVQAKEFLLRVASRLAPSFPHHANAVRGELIDTRLTGERWTRAAHCLASLAAQPGHTLTRDEHDIRLLVGGAINVARKVAATSSGIGRVEEFRESALWLMQDLEAELSSA